MDSELDYDMTNSPPIVCLMCKSARKKDERLFMFGGNRPFMAKFEAKFVSFIGRDKLLDLQEKYSTKRDRSYICKHCYSVVDKTFDNIKKIQQGVARSVRKALSQEVTADDEYGSDQEWGSNTQANLSKKKLPPVAERIAEKVASLTLVKINHKVPKIVLEPVIIRCDPDFSNQNDDDERSCVRFNESNDVQIHHLGSINVVKDNALQTGQFNINQGECYAHRPEEDDKMETAIKSQAKNMCTSNKLSVQSSLPLNTSKSITAHNYKDKVCDTESHNVDERQVNATTGLLDNTNSQGHKTDIFNEDHLSCTKSSPAELAEILANPLLMVKSPQPIRLLDVKNGNVYICGEDGCDWIFSSRFFWENHIRHYHYYGKPHKCPFDGCNKYFPTKSKQKQHVRKHTGERPFVCEECGKAFRGSQELRHHRGTHTVGKPYQCPKPGCYKSFKYINSMKRHLQFHDGNYPFPCSYSKCTKAFKNKYELKCHNRLHTGERPYKCKESGCDKAFRLPCEYTKHRRAHTGERPFKCTWEGCSAAYITCGGLASHMLSHSNDQHFCCEFCGKTFKHKLSYHSHLRRHTDPSEDFTCEVEGCGKLYKSKAQLLNHMTDLHGQLQIHKDKLKSRAHKYLCHVEDCHKEYVDKKLMDQHMASMHNIQTYHPTMGKHKKACLSDEERCCSLDIPTDELKCSRLKASSENLSTEEKAESRIFSCPFEKCEKKYESCDCLSDHMVKVHASMPREKMCHLCGKAFPHVQQLELHVHSFHEETSVLNDHVKGIFLCNAERCGQRLSSAAELKAHVAWHITNPPYRCEFEDCRKTFLLEKVYNNHIQDHKNLKPHACSFDGCQEQFSTHLKLLKHSSTHYGCFRCPIDGCGKMLQAINSARIHLFRHTGEKPYACTLCGMRFAACAQWIRHKRTHSGEKPYQCDECHTRFADSGILKIHMRNHTGEKPYRCEQCGQQFVSQASWKSHMRTHTGELPFVCPSEGCGKAFRERGSLKSHQNVHSKPSHLCSQCGKIYKFSINKHKCKVQPQASVNSHHVLLQPPRQSHIHYLQPAAVSQELHSPALAQQQQHQQSLHQPLLPPPPQYMTNTAMMMTTDPIPRSSCMAEVEEAAWTDKSNCTAQGSQDSALMHNIDRSNIISSPYCNYMFLYDRPVPK